MRADLIDGYENYLIQEDGKIFNIKRNSKMKLQKNKFGYIKVGLTNSNGKYKMFYHHRLLAIHFIQNPENKKEIDHIDKNPSNNRLENLRWVNKSEQQYNRNIFKNNKLGIKNICFNNGYYRFQFKNVSKYFKTIEEAINFKKTLLLN